MIDSLRGSMQILREVEKGITEVAIELSGGIAYSVTIATFPAADDDVIVYVAPVGERLYGFSTRWRRTAFLAAMTIKGVGPKTAMRVIANVPAGETATPAQVAEHGRIKLPQATAVLTAIRKAVLA